MTLFFPDLNVWLALTVAGHSHSSSAWNWMRKLAPDSRLVFSRYTQLGLLRLLTNSSVMGGQTLTLRKAWSVYDRWIQDSRVDFYPEPREADAQLRKITEPFAAQQATKAIGDCWLLAFANGTPATLVTFDRALYDFSRKRNYSCVIPA
jgi:uncharacterized protein